MPNSVRVPVLMRDPNLGTLYAADPSRCAKPDLRACPNRDSLYVPCHNTFCYDHVGHPGRDGRHPDHDLARLQMLA